MNPLKRATDTLPSTDFGKADEWQVAMRSAVCFWVLDVSDKNVYRFI